MTFALVCDTHFSAWLLTGDWVEYHVLGLSDAWLTLGAAPSLSLSCLPVTQTRLGFLLSCHF